MIGELVIKDFVRRLKVLNGKTCEISSPSIDSFL